MTTTDAPAEPKKGHSIIDAMKRGREYATAFVLIVSFLHSMYASYFKPEEIAEVGYKTTAEAVEGYSLRVNDEIETLKARIKELEEAQPAVAEPVRVPVSMVPVIPNTKSNRLKAHVEIVDVDGDGIVESDLTGVSAAVVPDSPSPDGLVIDLPDAPWANQKMK